MPKPLLLKTYVLPIVTWSFFSFSILMLAGLFPLNTLLIVTLFNALALGYFFYFGIQHGFPTATTFGLSMLAFHVLIGSLFYLYDQFVLLRESHILPYRLLLYAISNAFVTPAFYLLFFMDVKTITNKFK